MSVIDFNHFRNLLLEATRSAFEEVQLENSQEHFYAFSLFHAPLWGYIIAPANTEEGLTRCAEEYKLDKHNLGYSKQSIEDLRRDLRWNPADWAYFDTGTTFFQPVNDWLEEQNLYEVSYEVKHTPMIQICREVLKQCDNDGLFTRVSPRQEIVLNIVMGDQDRSWIEHARLLNPPDVYAQWLNEVGV